jgi:hypothetical protein
MQLTNLQVIKIAIQRAYSQLDASLRALLSACELQLGYYDESWSVLIIAPHQNIWKRLVKRSESIARRFSRVMSTFTLTFCLKEGALPTSPAGLWRVQKNFWIDEQWWLQMQHQEQRYWVSVAPASLWSPNGIDAETIESDLDW